MAGEYDWDAAWTTTTGINAATVTNAGTDVTETLSNDTKLATEVSIEIAYGATATEGVVVSILRDVDATNLEGTGDAPYAFSMPFSTNTTHRRTITISGSTSAFRVHLANDSGASVTATVRYRQAVAAA